MSETIWDVPEDRIFYREHARDSDNNLTVAKASDGRLLFGVSDEKAVDSYNSVFTCYFSLSPEDAAKFLEWLNQPGKPSPVQPLPS